MARTQDDPDATELTTAELVSRLSEQMSKLVRDELRLAQAELRVKGKRLGLGGGLAAGSAVMAGFGFATLLAAVVAAIALVLPVWAAAAIVAGVLLLVAGVLGVVAKRQAARATPPIPEQAISGARRDIDTIKEHAHR